MPHSRPITRFSCALITGASSGLGLEYARQLAPETETLILVARRDHLLRDLAQDLVNRHPSLRVRTIPCDLADPNERQHLLNTLSQSRLYPDLLLNNAGMGDYGEFRTSEWPKNEQMLRLNIEALTHLTHSLLPGLIAKRGAIINLSSLASTLPIPDFAVYAASKAYVTSFSEGLRLELREQGIRVLAVCPGPIKTEFGESARRHHTSKLPVKEAFYVSTEQVVHDSLKALHADHARIYPGLKIAAAATLFSILPIAAIRLIMSVRPRRSD